MTRPELVELGVSKTKDQFLAYRPMSYFTKKNSLMKYDFFSELDPLDYVEI